MKNVWKLSNYLFGWQWKKWNRNVTLLSLLLGMVFLIGAALPTGNPAGYEYYPKVFSSYDMIVDQSWMPLAFVVGLLAILVGIALQMHSFSTNGKGIYTLFLLPMRRREVYLSFLLSAMASVALYYVLWLLLLIVAYFPMMAIYESRAAEVVFQMTRDTVVTGLEVQHSNGLFLAFRRSSFLALCFPVLFWEVVPMLGGLALLLTGIFFLEFYRAEIGFRWIGGIGSFLAGGYLYLQNGWEWTYRNTISMGRGLLLGIIGLVFAVCLHWSVMRMLEERKDL